MGDGEYLTRTEVEKLIDQRIDQFKNERMRNQRMINSLQEEVEQLRERVVGEEQYAEKKGKREKIELEHKVMRAVAKEIEQSRRNVADPDAVINRVNDQGHLRSMAKLKIDDLVENDQLIRQGSGDLVFMDPEFTDIALLDDHYQDIKP